MKITIERLYPEFCDLYGDRGNITYLLKKLEAVGAEAEIIDTSVFDRPAFTGKNVDLLYIGPCSERPQEKIAELLMPYREALIERRDSEKITLATGNAFELFGERVVCTDGREFNALGFFPTCAKRFSRLRFNDVCVGAELSCLDKLVGFKNQLSHSYGTVGSPFLLMLRGSGLNPDTKSEGYRVKNFIATYLLGPILPLNPNFSASLLEKLCPAAAEKLLPFENAAYSDRINELCPGEITEKQLF